MHSSLLDPTDDEHRRTPFVGVPPVTSEATAMVSDTVISPRYEGEAIRGRHCPSYQCRLVARS